MHYYVYILYSDSVSRYYTGQCEDIVNRLSEHNSGQTPSIKHGIPWWVVWSHEVPTRREALALERKIKSGGAERYIKDLGIR